MAIEAVRHNMLQTKELDNEESIKRDAEII
jgi:hypothetical protein